MLESAKKNIGNFRFFGLTKCMYLNQYLFERTYPGVKLSNILQPRSNISFDSERGNTQKLLKEFSISKPTLVKQIKDVNKYDIEFYEYAKELYYSRLMEALQTDEKFRQTKLYKRKISQIKRVVNLNELTEEIGGELLKLDSRANIN